MFVFGGGGGGFAPRHPRPHPHPHPLYMAILPFNSFSKNDFRWPFRLATASISGSFLARDLNYFNRRSNKKIGSMLEYLRELGSSCITFRDLESSSKLILGSTWEYFKGAGGGGGGGGLGIIFQGELTPPHPKRTHS